MTVSPHCQNWPRRATAFGSGALWCLAVLLLGGFAGSAQAQERGRAESGHRDSSARLEHLPFVALLWQQQDRPSPPAAGPRRRAGDRSRPGPPPRLVERTRNLSPEQRERILENNRRFQELPPERQDQLRERFRELRGLPPEQRELVEQRFAIFSNLTPEQQEKARAIYRDRWSKLPPERRRALLQEFRRLRGLDPDRRQQRLKSKEFEEQFSSDERDVLAELIVL